MNRILAAIDTTARARDVLGAALALAEKSESKVILFHAVAPPMPLGEPIVGTRENFGLDLLDAARRELTTLADEVGPERIGGVDVDFASPWSGICEAAKKHDVELIVIGAHGYGLLDRLLGTTASKVVNHADRSVLVVREPERITLETEPVEPGPGPAREARVAPSFLRPDWP